MTPYQPLPWAATPAYAEMCAALAAVGCAGAERACGDGSADVPPADWPHSDRAVRDRFHAAWTAAMQTRCRIDPMRDPNTKPGTITLPDGTVTYPTLSDAERADAIARYNAGESGNAIAASFGVHHRTVYNLLKRSGVTSRAKWAVRKQAKGENAARAMERHTAGEDTDTIAAALGISRQRVNQLLREQGVVYDVNAIRRQNGIARWANATDDDRARWANADARDRGRQIANQKRARKASLEHSRMAALKRAAKRNAA